ncbi:MAG TPA: hypothetical protein DDY20_01765 [Desulfobulbaceae bacterium]|nr:hypothetical protein [Desulfobulbaceae bacterium]
MSLRKFWPCWEIMKCNPEDAAQCPAFKSKKPCWEVMRKFDNYSFNICRDCIVYVVKQKDSIFSLEETLSIMNQKGVDVAGLRCPHFSPARPEHSFAE